MVNLRKQYRSTGCLLAGSFLLLMLCWVSVGPAKASPVRPIVIGTSLSLSGDFAADGQAFKQGYLLWLDAINHAGGLLGRPVKLIILADSSSPAQVTANYQKLILQDHVDLLFGPFSTLLTIPAAAVAQRYGYALVEGAGGGPAVFSQGLHNVFDVSVPVANSLTSFAQFLIALPAARRPKSVAYATEDDPFTQPQIDVARTLLEKGGIHTALRMVYPASTTNYAPIATAVAHSHADVTVLGTFLPDIIAFMQGFRKQHYNPAAIIATAGPDTGNQFVQAVGPSNTEGIFVPNGWYPEASNMGNAAMVKAYLAAYGGSADAISADVAEAYSVGQTVTQAVSMARTINNATLIHELHTATFNSVQGPVKFNSAGQNVIAEDYLFQWQNGILLPVFPGSAAALPPEYPKPAWP